MEDISTAKLTEPPPPSTKEVTRISNHKTIVIIIIVLLVLVVIMLTLVAVNFAYAHKIKSSLQEGDVVVHQGIWSIFNTAQLCGTVISNCVSINGSSSYGRCVWPFLGDRPFTLSNLAEPERTAHLVGAHTMTYNDAILVFGKIPRNRVYWAWSGYLYSVPGEGPPSDVVNQTVIIAGTVGDSIDSGNTVSRTEDDYLALVFTPNPEMFDVVQKQFKTNNRFYSTDDFSIQWKMIPIGSNMYASKYTYCLFSRIVQSDYDSSVPPWNCWWFQAKSGVVAGPTLPVMPVQQVRSTEPNEINLYFQGDVQNWYAQTLQTAQTRFPQSDALTLDYLQQTVPLMSWVEGMCPSPEACGLRCGCQGLVYSQNIRFDNDSTIYYVCYPIEVKKNQVLYVIALDHVASTAITAYSNLTFTDYLTEYSWSGVITGVNDPLAPPPPNAPDGKWPPPIGQGFVQVVESFVVVPDDVFDPITNIAQVIITERAYLNPVNQTGPWYTSLAPFQVFLLDNKYVPTGGYTPSYPYSI